MLTSDQIHEIYNPPEQSDTSSELNLKEKLAWDYRERERVDDPHQTNVRIVRGQLAS